MSAPLSRWLALREPADVAARSELLTRRVADGLRPADVVSVLDLATGTGSNLRYLVDRLPGRQAWLLVDRDPVLLSDVAGRTAAWAADRAYDLQHESGNSFVVRGPRLECRVDTRQMNLGTLDAGLFAGRHLVTASALLDLVSDDWLGALAGHCRAAGAAALFTITYNGRSSCMPADPDDGMIRELMNQHQKRDKGLGGPAAGPDAPDVAERRFLDAGFVVDRARTDWVFDAGARDDRCDVPRRDVPSTDGPRSVRLQPDLDELQRELIEGWAEAAIEMAPHLAERIARWKDRRLAHIAAGQSRIVVGHDDVAAWIPAR